MLNEAERLDMIYKNPLKRVRKISTKKSEKGILSIEEYRQLFDEVNIETIWNGNLLHFTANLLSASGGLRLGEVQALRNQDIFKNYVYVGHSYDRKYGLKSTKNKEERYVPIPGKTSSYLQRIKGRAPEGFIFSIDGGKKPIRYRAITDFFYRVLEKIGIGEGERKARDISFHSHRHFFTTVLRKKIDDTKLGKITGHKSIVMLERYDHPKFDIDEYQDVLKIQSELWE
jgi:integrase